MYLLLRRLAQLLRLMPRTDGMWGPGLPPPPLPDADPAFQPPETPPPPGQASR